MSWDSKQNCPLGQVHQGCGWLLFLGGALLLNLEYGSPLLNLLYLGMAFVGPFMIIRGRRLVTPSADAVLDSDKRPPVIYLRSFDAETGDYGVAAYLRSALRIASKRRLPPGCDWLPTFNLKLAKIFRGVGPYVAVGRPGEAIPGMGAARAYFSDDEWKDQVGALLKRASLVVMRAGTTKGLNWEIQAVRAWLRPQQLLIVLPFGNEEYQLFRNILLSQAQIELPETQPVSRLLTFADQWQPLALTTAFTLGKTLRPFFIQNGLHPPSGT